MLDDEKITRLFRSGLGARLIAKEIGHPRHVSVTRRLRKLGLIRPAKRVSNSTRAIPSMGLDLSNLPNSAEHFARFAMSMLGYSILTSDRGLSYDFLAIRNNEIYKVQVKSSRYLHNGSFAFSLKRSRNNSTGQTRKTYRPEEVDYFFLVDANLSSWLIPSKELSGRTSCSPSDGYPNCRITENGKFVI